MCCRLAPSSLIFDDLEPFQIQVTELIKYLKSNAVVDTMLVTNKVIQETTNRLPISSMTFDLEQSLLKVIKITRRIFKNGDRYDNGVNRSRRTWQNLVCIMELETECIGQIQVPQNVSLVVMIDYLINQLIDYRYNRLIVAALFVTLLTIEICIIASIYAASRM